MSGGIIIYDGVCVLCSRSVKFIIAHDHERYFKFMTLQSEAAQEFIKSNNIQGNSIVVVDHGKVYQRSDAILEICKHLKGGFKHLSYFTIIPKFLRDGIYNIIAKNRYQWFGKKEICDMPSDEIRARLLND